MPNRTRNPIRRLAARQEFERGAIVLIACIATIALTAVAALTLDGVGYYNQRSQQVNASEMCLQTVESERATLVKFSDNPGRDIAEMACRTLRQNGYDGPISVHYWEDTSKATMTDRYYAYAIECDGTYSSLFGGIVGQDELDVKSTVFGGERLYNSDLCWRPKWTNEANPAMYEPGNGTYSYMEGEDWNETAAFDAANTISDYPSYVTEGFKQIYGTAE